MQQLRDQIQQGMASVVRTHADMNNMHADEMRVLKDQIRNLQANQTSANDDTDDNGNRQRKNKRKRAPSDSPSMRYIAPPFAKATGPTADQTWMKYGNTNYCWTHGYNIAANHTSATCRRQAPGHQTAATRENIMGGSEAFKLELNL